MESKKSRCEIFVGKMGSFYLISDEQPMANEVILDKLPDGKIGRYTCLMVDYPSKNYHKIIATNNPGCAIVLLGIPKLPEYVIEAYNSGVRDFEIEYVAKTTWELQFKQGLLHVTYEKPKKQNFTRDEAIALINDARYHRAHCGAEYIVDNPRT